MGDLAAVTADLVWANRILARKGIVDAFGHVSARHPDRPDRFLLSRNRAPALVEGSDILEFDLAGETVAGDHPPVYLERFIHAALYRARADVGAVVHSHSPSVIPFGAARGACLGCVSHMAGFLGTETPVFEIRDVAGEASDLLVRDNALGDAMVAAMGAAPVVLMRGHGATTVGRDIAQAVFHAVYTEWNARILAGTMAIGEPVLLTDEECVAAAAANDGQIGRAWDYWKIEVAGMGDTQA